MIGTLGLESPGIPSEFGLSELATSVFDGVFITAFRITGIVFSTLECHNAGRRLVIFRTKDCNKGLLRDIHAAEQLHLGFPLFLLL